jgi:hypothetical protein
MAAAPVGYGQVVRHPVAGRLVVAKLVSELGDYIGLAALILLAFGESHSVLGPVGVYAARSLPAVAVATVFPGWLDRLPRRGALVGLMLLGAVVITVPAVNPSTGSAIAAATALGAIRAAYLGVHTGVIAEAVDAAVRLPLFGLMAMFNQAAQVVGVATGSAVSLYLAPRWALLADAVSFAVAAAIFNGLPRLVPVLRERRPLPYAGIRTIASHPTMRLLVVLTWATVASSGLPEVLAPAVASRAWIPYVMAASATGGATFAYLAARRSFLSQVANQIRVAGLGAAGLIGGGVLLLAHAPSWTIVLANAVVGAGIGWLIGAQATIAQLTPPGRMGQVEATIVAANILLQGAGVLVFGGIVAATGDPGLAYLGGGTLVGAMALASLRRAARPAPVPS